MCVQGIIYLSLLSAILNSWHKNTFGNASTLKFKQSSCDLTETETGEPAGIAQDITSNCKCQKEIKKCHSEISWKPPLPGKHNVTGYHLAIYDDVRRPTCYKLPKDERHFRFNKTAGEDSDFYLYSVTAEPVYHQKEAIQNIMYCPKDLEISSHLSNKKIHSYEDHVFNCTFEGCPEPDNITWIFTPDLKTFKDERILQDDNEHIKIRKGKSVTTLTVLRATKADEGRYTCYISNYFHSSDSKYGDLHILDEPMSMEKNKLGPILGAITGSILLLVTVFTIFKCFIIKRMKYDRKEVRKQHVYVSHCSIDEKEEKKLVKFASYLQDNLCGITIVMDLIEDNEINEVGMAQWVPEQMQKADKILVVLSKDYLKSLQSYDQNDTVCKIHEEHRHIQTLIHQSCQSTDKLILVSDGIKSEDLPDIYLGRSYFLFPKDIGKSIRSNDSINLLSVLSGGNIVRHHNEEKLIEIRIENLRK